MTLEQLGSLGEFLAAVATLVTLVYLALQIRQNTRATRAASHHAVTDSMNQVNRSMIESPAFAQVWTKGSRDRSSLSEVERWQFDLQLLSYFHVFDTMHYEARVGAGERELLAAEEKSLAALFAWPGVREWWAENPYAFGPEFREFVERFREDD